MYTMLDINTDIKDCELLKVHHTVSGDKILIHIIPELATVDCTKCMEEHAKYHVHIVTAHESNDLIATLCEEHYQEVDRLCELNIPTRVLH